MAKKAKCETPGCGMAQEVSVVQEATQKAAQFCRVHADRWSGKEGFVVAALSGSLAVCPTCSRVIGHGARAAHNCFAR